MVVSLFYVVVVNNKMVAVSGGQTYRQQTAHSRLCRLRCPVGHHFGRQSATLTVYNNRLWFVAGRTVLPDQHARYRRRTERRRRKSADGVTWTQVTAHAPFAPRYQHLAFVMNGRLWVVGGRHFSGGIAGSFVGDAWSTTDGITWKHETVNARRHQFPDAGRTRAGQGDALWRSPGRFHEQCLADHRRLELVRDHAARPIRPTLHQRQPSSTGRCGSSAAK